MNFPLQSSVYIMAATLHHDFSFPALRCSTRCLYCSLLLSTSREDRRQQDEGEAASPCSGACEADCPGSCGEEGTLPPSLHRMILVDQCNSRLSVHRSRLRDGPTRSRLCAAAPSPIARRVRYRVSMRWSHAVRLRWLHVTQSSTHRSYWKASCCSCQRRSSSKWKGSARTGA